MLITKHYYKASGNINQFVYCPPLPSTHSHVHSLSFLYLKTFLEVSKSSQDWTKQESKARDIPEVCSWARISHCSPGRNSKRNSCPCEAVIKYSTSPMRGRRAKPAAKKKLHFFSVSVQTQKPLVSRQNFSWGFFRNVLLIWDQRRRIMSAVK